MKLGIIAVVFALIGGAIWMSDVWRTKVGNQITQFSQWTPENIAKYPEDYLTFCEGQVNKVLEDIKVRQISITQSKASVSAIRDDAAEKTALGQKVLGQLKGLYASASESNTWPVMWEQQSRNEEWTRTNIEQIHNQIKLKNAIVEKCEGAIARLNVQESRLPQVRSQAQQQLAEIQANREILKVNRLTDDLSKQLITMKGMVQGIITNANDQPANVNLDDLKAGSTGSPTDENFKKIMAEK